MRLDLAPLLRWGNECVVEANDFPLSVFLHQHKGRGCAVIPGKRAGWRTHVAFCVGEDYAIHHFPRLQQLVGYRAVLVDGIEDTVMPLRYGLPAPMVVPANGYEICVFGERFPESFSIP